MMEGEQMQIRHINEASARVCETELPGVNCAIDYLDLYLNEMLFLLAVYSV